ncbi:MAG: glycosyltransferase family 2 protein [Clostridia bacterium]|nr:glycosyltransferase family 2 protein [Clostridia bacterium]
MSDFNSCPCLWLVVPCYNEQEVLPQSFETLADKLQRMIDSKVCSNASRILFVDDGSRDNTWELIENFHKESPLACGVKLSRNRGHQNALLAGLMQAKEYCDCAISLDADLQDDIEVLDKFVAEYVGGCDVVYGVRGSRRTDSAFKRGTAHGFYKLMNFMGAETVYNHADYRLMSRRALEALSDYREVNLFLRGIVPLIGFKSTTVEYARGKRAAGQSKYPLRKMLSFAVEGITSFSVKPIKFIAGLGVVISLLSVLGLIYALVSKFTGNAQQGWTAIVASIWLIGGIQLFCLGVIGEYIGKIYTEVKGRPKYNIDIFLKK